MERPRVVVLCGQSKSGKSTVAVHLAAKDARVIVAAPYQKNPYGAMAFTDYKTCRDTLCHVKPKKFRVAVPCYTPDDLAALCRLAWAFAPCTLIVDETAFCIPNAMTAPQELRYVAQIGRHAGHDEEQEVRLILLGQRPANIPPFARAEAKDVYIFSLEREDDCYTACRDFGIPERDGLRDQVAARLSEMPLHDRLHIIKREDGKRDYQWGQGI